MEREPKRKKEKGRERKRERCCREALGSACLHLHTRCALPQLWNVFVRSSLTTDPPNHYHRNLIQTILSASFIVCARSSLYYLDSSIYFLSLLLLKKSVPKPIFQILFPQCSPFFNYWLLNVFTQTHAHTLYKHRFTLIHRHSCWLHFNGNPWAVTRQ